MIMTDRNKIWISREILSNGPGYKAFPAQYSSHGDKITTRMNMGKVVKTIYIPTSAEWEPPDYLMDRWWEVVNEDGNTVGLKCRIPRPERRHRFR